MSDVHRTEQFKRVIAQYMPFLPKDVIAREVASLNAHGYCNTGELKTVLEIARYERAEELRKMIEAA